MKIFYSLLFLLLLSSNQSEIRKWVLIDDSREESYYFFNDSMVVRTINYNTKSINNKTELSVDYVNPVIETCNYDYKDENYYYKYFHESSNDTVIDVFCVFQSDSTEFLRKMFRLYNNRSDTMLYPPSRIYYPEK